MAHGRRIKIPIHGKHVECVEHLVIKEAYQCFNIVSIVHLKRLLACCIMGRVTSCLTLRLFVFMDGLELGQNVPDPMGRRIQLHRFNSTISVIAICLRLFLFDSFKLIVEYG